MSQCQEFCLFVILKWKSLKWFLRKNHFNLGQDINIILPNNSYCQGNICSDKPPLHKIIQWWTTPPSFGLLWCQLILTRPSLLLFVVWQFFFLLFNKIIKYVTTFSISNENTCSGCRVKLGKTLWDCSFLIDCVLKELSGFSFPTQSRVPLYLSLDLLDYINI